MKIVPTRRANPTFHRTTVRTRRKNPPRIACSGCGNTAGDLFACSCLSETRLYREAFEHLPGLLKSGRGLNPAPIVYLAARRRAREALDQIVVLEEQRARETAAYRAFIRDLFANPHPRYAASRDREILDHLFFVYRRSPSLRSLEQVAAAWSRPAGYVRDLRDRCLEAMCHWPSEKGAAAVSRRAGRPSTAAPFRPISEAA